MAEAQQGIGSVPRRWLYKRFGKIRVGQVGSQVHQVKKELELEFKPFELFFGGGDIAGGRFGGAFVTLRDGKFDQLGRILNAAVQPAPGFHPVADGGEFLHFGASGFGVVPEARSGGLVF